MLRQAPLTPKTATPEGDRRANPHPPTGMSIERPWGFSRAALNFAREEGTGAFYTTGSFKGSMVLGRKDICNVQSCYKVRSSPLCGLIYLILTLPDVRSLP